MDGTLEQLLNYYRGYQSPGRYVGPQWVPNNHDQMVRGPTALPNDKNTFHPDDVMSILSLLARQERI